MATENKSTIEGNFEEISAIIEKMQDENISLEESFELYKKGLEKIKDSNDKIEKVEKEIEIIEKQIEKE